MEKNIDIKELREIVNNLFDYTEKVLKVEKIPVNQNLYWYLDDKSVYDIETNPKENNFAIGDLFEDLSDLENIKDDNEYANTMQFRYLSSIFRYLSETDEWFKP